MRRVFKLPEMAPVGKHHSENITGYNESRDGVQVFLDADLWSKWHARSHRDNPQDNSTEANVEDVIKLWNPRKESLPSNLQNRTAKFYSDGTKRRRIADTVHDPRTDIDKSSNGRNIASANPGAPQQQPFGSLPKQSAPEIRTARNGNQPIGPRRPIIASQKHPVSNMPAPIWVLSDSEEENEPNTGHNALAKVNKERPGSSAVGRPAQHQRTSLESDRRLMGRSLETSGAKVEPHGLVSRMPSQQRSSIVVSQPATSQQPRSAGNINGASMYGSTSTNTAILDHNTSSSLPGRVQPQPPVASTLMAAQVAGNSLTTERQAASKHLDRFAHLPLNDRTQALFNLVYQDRQNMTQTSVWTSHEDALLIHVKEALLLTWDVIWQRFFRHRGRSWHTSQTRYSQKLAIRRRFDPTRYTQNVTTRVSVPNEISTIQPVVRKSVRRQHNTAAQTSMYPRTERDSEEENQRRESENWRPDVVEAEQDLALRAVAMLHRNSNGLSTASRAIANIPQKPNALHIPYKRLSEERHRTRAALISCTVKISRSVLPLTGNLCARLFDQHSKVSQPPIQLVQHLKRISPPLKRRSLDVQRPYLSHVERQFLRDSIKRRFWHSNETSLWQDQTLHVDFTYEEMEKLYPFVVRVVCSQYDSPPVGLKFADILKEASDEQLQKIARAAQSRGGVYNRTLDSLKSFLRDMRSREENRKTLYQRLALDSPSEAPTRPNLHGFLRRREVGMSSVAARIPCDFRNAVEDTMGPLMSFTGTSGDVNAVAWAPNGEVFGVGSAALVDDHSMQYNQGNNLLLGRLTTKVLTELAHHATKRHQTSSGVNSLYSMQASQDPLLFQSISALQFSTDSKALISTGYDNFARVWDLRGPSPVCKWSFRHRAVVDVLAINSAGLFATGARRSGGNSVRVLKHDLDCEDPASLKAFSFYSPKANNAPAKQICPASLRWGDSIYAQQNYLLCGFTSKLEEHGEGEACVWDVEAQQQTATTRGTQGVFDVAWSPTIYGRFAVGSSAGGSSKVNKGTHSVVSIFDARYLPNGGDDGGSNLAVNKWKTCELECSARDMNDVVFNPSDPWLISAGCTDGSTHIWDLRKPDKLLHRFAHGPAAMELDHRVVREEADTGVRFVSWGGTRGRLYTGSSDGVVAQWDPYRAPEDAFVRQVVQLNSGVMSGAFNADFSNLLLGEVNGSIMMLGLSQNEDGGNVRNCEEFSLDKADEASLGEIYKSLEIEAPTVSAETHNLGMLAARQLVDTGQITIRPFGDLPFRQAVRGPNYAGPFDNTEGAEQLRNRAEDFQDKFKVSENQAQIHDRGAERVTEEEKGDSRAWERRIPASFRFDKPMDELTCLRCEHKLEYSPKSDTVRCSHCEQMWRVDVLGYSPMRSDSQAATIASTTIDDINDMHGNEAHESEPQETGDSEDELQDLEGYLHSLWLDRPRPSV